MKEEGVDYVDCRCCGARISKITVPHLRRCGANITVRQYKLKFPGVPIEATVKKRTEAQRLAQSEKLKARFKTAEGQATKRRISEASKAMQAGEYGAIAAEHLRKLTSDPTHLKEMSRRSKQAWATGTLREKQAAWIHANRDKVEASAANARAHITCWDKPEHRKKMARLMQDRWGDPLFRDQMNALVGQKWSETEFREKMEDMMRERWADPVFRQKMEEYYKERWKDPAYQRLMSEHMKRRWRGDFRCKMAEVRARTIMPFWDSRIELRFQSLLDQMGIPYRKHGCVPGCGSHQYDILLDGPKVLVELQGCWWHACAVCDKDKVKDAGQAQARRARDVRKRALAEAAGWRLLEVWEHEFKNLGAVEQRVRAFLG